VYGYGRWEYLGEQRSVKTGKARQRLRPLTEWPVLLHGHHAAYVSWEEFMHTQDQLRQNWPREGRRGVARDGAALLQGIVWCGRCGRKMSVQYHAPTDKRSPAYICQQGQHQQGEDSICQSMTIRLVGHAANKESFAPEKG
jgi:hypothetical protein